MAAARRVSYAYPAENSCLARIRSPKAARRTAMLLTMLPAMLQHSRKHCARHIVMAQGTAAGCVAVIHPANLFNLI